MAAAAQGGRCTVQDDDFSPFCKTASSGTPDVGDMTMRVLTTQYDQADSVQGPIQELAGDKLQAVARAMPRYFCGAQADATDSGAGGADTKVKGGDGDAVDPLLSDSGKTVDEICAMQKQPEPRRKCADGLKKGFEAVNDRGTIAQQKLGKKIKDGAKHGDANFAAWGVANGQLQSTGAGGLRVATWNQPPSAATDARDAETVAKIAVAQSEFYFEPRQDGPKRWAAESGSPAAAAGGDPSATGNAGSVKDEALYHMRWRARLRRVHLPDAQTLAPSEGAGGDSQEALQKLVAGAGGGASGSQILH